MSDLDVRNVRRLAIGRSLALLVGMAAALVAHEAVVAADDAAPLPAADAIAAVILGSDDRSQATEKLRALHPTLRGPEWALEPLLAEVVAGTDKPSHLRAVCRLDTWGDGAWWMEIGGQAYDAVVEAPGRFARRYLEGDDCALLMILYAGTLPAEELPTVHGCSADLGQEFARIGRDLKRIRDGVWDAVDTRDPDPRHRTAFEVVNALVEAWPGIRDRHVDWCAEMKKVSRGS